MSIRPVLCATFVGLLAACGNEVDDLLEDLGKDAGTALAAHQRLVGMEKPPVMDLARAVRERPPNVARRAAFVLAELGPRSAPAAAELTAVLEDSTRSWESRSSAALPLIAIGGDGWEKVIRALRKDRKGIREALWVLGSKPARTGALGTRPVPRAAVDLLHEVAADTAGGAQIEALSVLHSMGLPWKDVEAAYLAASQNSYSSTMLDYPADQVIPSLMRRLREEPMAFGASHAVKRFGERAVAPLVEATKDPDSEVREQASRLLGDLGPAGKGARQRLVDLSLDRSQPSHVRTSATIALGLTNREDPLARAALETLSKDSDSFVRAAAREMLGSPPEAGR